MGRKVLEWSNFEGYSGNYTGCAVVELESVV